MGVEVMEDVGGRHTSLGQRSDYHWAAGKIRTSCRVIRARLTAGVARQLARRFGLITPCAR